MKTCNTKFKISIANLVLKCVFYLLNCRVLDNMLFSYILTVCQSPQYASVSTIHCIVIAACKVSPKVSTFYLPKCGPQCQLTAPFNGTGQVAVLNSRIQIDGSALPDKLHQLKLKEMFSSHKMISL